MYSPSDAIRYPMEFLNSLIISGLPRHILTLKAGAPILILRNINPPTLCNGARLCVKSLNNSIVEATILILDVKKVKMYIYREYKE